MKLEYAPQYEVQCIVLEGDEDYGQVLEMAFDRHQCIVPEGEDDLVCVRFPARTQELYTTAAITRALSAEAIARRKERMKENTKQ